MSFTPPRRPSEARRSAALARAALLTAVFAACEERTASTPPPTKASPSAPDPSGSSGPPTTATANPHVAPTSVGTGTTPQTQSDCPAWVRAPRCVAGEDVVGVAGVRGVRDANLARTTAENRAVARALSEEGRADSAGPHAVLEITTCDGATWARVTVPRGRVEDASGLPRCP